MNRRIGRMLFACIVSFCSPALAKSQPADVVQPFGSVRFSQDSDVKCLSSAIEAGSPATGPSTWILKAPPGCVIPWHFHTAQEQLIILSGTVLSEMTDHLPTPLGPGGFAMMSSRMAHQFSCQGAAGCLMVITFDKAYDIWWGKGG